MKNQENGMLMPLSESESNTIVGGGSIFHSFGVLTKKAWCAVKDAYTSFKESPGGGQSGVVGMNTYGGNSIKEA
ncbi:hypothetical protein A3SI_12219 [Nitritalea halalkaliphila LW7]|uniref:Uncharacterized protein n=1 Tax=Nitritalea halalkaliphila LW7 TaxID=1189621 RepID=I5C1V9_9BACT|nr:hypothetical protein [Nitritalea halalkaliphila]EIM75811.1 hypothetical protein A3SI_12219 [Nitritalea halalkaliphila LW7]